LHPPFVRDNPNKTGLDVSDLNVFVPQAENDPVLREAQESINRRTKDQQPAFVDEKDGNEESSQITAMHKTPAPSSISTAAWPPIFAANISVRFLAAGLGWPQIYLAIVQGYTKESAWHAKGFW
jgi:hypothetical protein